MIKILPPDIVKKIAAGEVVDKPASALKELLENAIDAEASIIKVVLTQGGIEKIQIIDNGKGMTHKDLEIAFTRHATSKIEHEDDLMNLTSLGFRGEALYSISAVSTVEVKTRTKETSEGYLLVVKGGEKGEIQKAGTPQGTSITISDIFANVPARKKFLKSAATEFKYCQDVFIAQALAHPSLRFELFHNDKKVLQLPESDFKTRIGQVYAIEENDLLPVFFDHQYLHITGFVGKPGIARTRKVKQHLFVNDRSVDNKLVYSAVKQGFGSYLPHGSYPLFFLRFEMRPDLYDVNIHPRKEEIKFSSSSLVFDGVRNAVAKVLSKSEDLTPAAGVTVSQESDFSQSAPSFSFQQTAGELPQEVHPTKHQVAEAMTFNQAFSEKALSQVSTSAEQQASRQLFPWEQSELSEAKFLFQVDLVYIVELGDKEIRIYDQHAVHERVLFEKFVVDYLSKQSEGQQQVLLFPEEFKLDLQEIEILQQEAAVLKKIGFEFQITETTVSIIAIPVVLKSDKLHERFLDFIDGLLSKEELEVDSDAQIDSRTKRTLTFLSCRSAIKAGDKLQLQEMKALLRDFSETKERYTCPHGRPVVVKLGRKELDKLFMRDKKEI